MTRRTVAFSLAVAATGAALADPVVEALANAGAFGPGAWTDRSNADVLPALAVGALFAAAFVVALVRREWTRVAADALPRPGAASLAATFVVQIALVFAMETVEQVAVAGRPLGGTVWAGGPLPISLAIHAAVGLAVRALLARILSGFARQVAAVLHRVGRLGVPWPGDRRVLCAAARIALAFDDDPALRRRYGRAPPLAQPRPI